MSVKVGVIGASGYIGSALVAELQSRGMAVIGISRVERKAEAFPWRTLGSECLRGLDVLINLAGEPIDQRWSEENKKKFHESRVGLAKQLASWMQELPENERPSVWVNISAVGIYGDRGEEVLSESSVAGEGYLAELCAEWENAAKNKQLNNCRIVLPRIGVVLGSKSHAWSRVHQVFKLGFGGKISSGRQWFPWVHETDVVASIAFLVENESAQGAFNIVAPESVTNAQFTQMLGNAVRRPTLFAVPAWLLRAVLGEFAVALLASLRVKPAKLEKLGYKWRYSTLNKAISDLCERS